MHRPYRPIAVGSSDLLSFLSLCCTVRTKSVTLRQSYTFLKCTEVTLKFNFSGVLDFAPPLSQSYLFLTMNKRSLLKTWKYTLCFLPKNWIRRLIPITLMSLNVKRSWSCLQLQLARLCLSAECREKQLANINSG